MLDFLIAIIVLYIPLIMGIASVSALALASGTKFLFDTPRDLYDNTSMNWFGCIFVWILELLLNPFVWMFYILFTVFKWLFTVGRK